MPVLTPDSRPFILSFQAGGSFLPKNLVRVHVSHHTQIDLLPVNRTVNKNHGYLTITNVIEISRSERL